MSPWNARNGLVLQLWHHGVFSPALFPSSTPHTTHTRSLDTPAMCITSPIATSLVSPGPPYSRPRLNDTTHLIVHLDKYSEFPFIYVKLYVDLSLAVIIDTGCGAENDHPKNSNAELKDFVQSDILSSQQANFNFLVVCTHCHFDHIGGIEALSKAGAKIVASGHDRDFLRPERRQENSLCGNFGTKTPEYEVNHYAQDYEELQHNGQGLGLQIIHTPGHTPDSLAIYDKAERWLYVGDTCYQRTATMPCGEVQVVPIVLPLQGKWKYLVESLRKLQAFVARAEESGSLVQLAAGHTTSGRPAADFLRMVVDFCRRIVAGRVDEALIPGDVVAPGGTLGDVMFVQWTGDEREEVALLVSEQFKKDF